MLNIWTRIWTYINSSKRIRSRKRSKNIRTVFIPADIYKHVFVPPEPNLLLSLSSLFFSAETWESNGATSWHRRWCSLQRQPCTMVVPPPPDLALGAPSIRTTIRSSRWAAARVEVGARRRRVFHPCSLTAYPRPGDFSAAAPGGSSVRGSMTDAGWLCSLQRAGDVTDASPVEATMSTLSLFSSL
jgi:hypothetical protein